MVAVYAFQIRRRPAAEGVSGRGMDRAAKQLNREMGERWHQLYLPRHFEEGAAERYDYQPRAARYKAMKSRRGLPPLVYRGTLKQLTKSSHVIRAYPTRFSVQMWGPRYATMRPRPPERGGTNTRPAIGAEVVKSHPDEEREMAAWASRRFVQLLDAERGSSSTETIR